MPWTAALSDAIETILGHHFTRPDLLREALTHRSALQGSGRGARLQRTAGVRRRPGARPADRGMARRTLPATSRRATWAGGWRIWCRSRCWPRSPRGSVWASVLSVAPGEARAGRASAAPPCWRTRWRRRWARSISMAAWSRARAFVRRAWDSAMVAPGGAAEGCQDHACRNGRRSAARDLPVYRGGRRAPARRTRRSSS